MTKQEKEQIKAEARRKYKLFVEQWPLLSELQQRLDLRIDFEAEAEIQEAEQDAQAKKNSNNK